MTLWAFGGEGELTLTFPAPRKPLSINKAHTMHWAARRRETDPWRDMCLIVARAACAAYARHHGQVWPIQPVDIRLDLPFRDAQRRDPHNYVGTVVKAAVDGLVRGGIVPDDNAEWATILEPTLSIQRDKTRPLVATVYITPRSTT
jgi:hypothetical protein